MMLNHNEIMQEWYAGVQYMKLQCFEFVISIFLGLDMGTVSAFQDFITSTNTGAHTATEQVVQSRGSQLAYKSNTLKLMMKLKSLREQLLKNHNLKGQEIKDNTNLIDAQSTAQPQISLMHLKFIMRQTDPHLVPRLCKCLSMLQQ